MSQLTTIADAKRVMTGAQALARFVNVFADSHLAINLAERLSCTELEALADLLEATGKSEAAEIWRSEHAQTDESGDLHYVAHHALTA